MVQIILLLFSFVLLAYFAITFFNRYKKKKLANKLENYQRLLEQARQSRFSYIRALKKAENVKSQIDSLDAELALIKAKLKEFHLELRKQLLELRRVRSGNTALDSDLEIIERKKNDFSLTWKAACTLKGPYNTKLKEVKSLHETFATLSIESRGKTETWHNDKRIVMKMYDELRSEVKISDPREVLQKSTRE